MQISQEERLENREEKHIDILDFAILLFLFAGPFVNVLLYMINGSSTSGQLARVYIIVAICAFILCIKNGRRYITSHFLVVIILMIVATTSFFYTRGRYGSTNAQFVSEFKSFLAMEGCILLLALNVCWSQKNTMNKRLMAAVSVVLTIVSFLALIGGDSLTTGGFVADTSGFIYQNIAYYSAYAMGITVFLLYEYKDSPKTRVTNIAMTILIFLQVLTSLLSGGRGGSVLSLFLLLYGLVSINGVKKSVKYIIPAIIILLLAIRFLPILAARLGVGTKGFMRVLNLLDRNELSTRGRTLYAQNAMAAFNNKPVLGNGIGSIFYLIGNYSHNMFTDILAETGIAGLIVVVLLLIVFLFKMKRLFHQGPFYRFMFIVFICGITLNLFSGYIWVNQHVWFPMAIILTAPRGRDIEV